MSRIAASMSREVVQWLKSQIEEIQGSCEHKYSCVKYPDLIMSKVEGTYVGVLSGPIQGKAPVLRFDLICSECDLPKSLSASSTCPMCYVSLVIEHECLGAGSREKYFGVEHIYYAIMTSKCSNPKCNFRIASDRWDQ